MGTQLVERSGRGLSLTPAGEELCAAAEKVGHELSAIVRRLGDEHDGTVRGTVRVSFPQILSEAVHALLTPIAESHPHVTLELVGDDRRLNLVSGEAEVVLRLASNPAPNLFGLRLGALTLGIYASPAYAMVHEPVDHPAHRWVNWSSYCRDQAAVRWLADTYPQRHVVAVAEHGFGTVDAVRAGMGIGVLPDLVARDLVRLEPLPTDRGVDLWLLCPSAVRRRPAVGAVMDALKQFAPTYPDALVRGRAKAVC